VGFSRKCSHLLRSKRVRGQQAPLRVAEFIPQYTIPDSTTYGNKTTLQCWSFLALSALTSFYSERRNIFLFVAFIKRVCVFVCVCVCVCVCARARVRVRINRLEAGGNPRFQTGKENICLPILNTKCLKKPPFFFHTTTSYIVRIFNITFRNISNFPSISFMFTCDKQNNWCMAGNVVNFIYESGHLSKALHTEAENYVSYSTQ